MVFVTGDKHGDVESFKTPSYKNIKKRDLLIICGDFGFIWENSKREKKNLKWLSKRTYEIAFVEGAHENFDLLSKYPVEEYLGGKVRRIAPNIVQFLTGEIYEINHQKFLCFGGGYDDSDLGKHTLNILGRHNQMKEAMERLMKKKEMQQGKVDYIISYEAPLSIKQCIDSEFSPNLFIHTALEEILAQVSFKKWFLGKYHQDKVISHRFQIVFQDLFLIDEKKVIASR